MGHFDGPAMKHWEDMQAAQAQGLGYIGGLLSGVADNLSYQLGGAQTVYTTSSDNFTVVFDPQPTKPDAQEPKPAGPLSPEVRWLQRRIHEISWYGDKAA